MFAISRGDTNVTNASTTVTYTSDTSADVGTITLNGTSTLTLDDTAAVSVSDSASGQLLESSEGGQATIIAENSGPGNFVFTIEAEPNLYGRGQGTTINYVTENTGTGTTTLNSAYAFNGGDGNDLTFWALYNGNDFAATTGGVVTAATAYYNDGGNDTGALNLATWAADTGNNQDYTSDSSLTVYSGTLTGDATKHGLRVSNALGAALDLGTHTLTEAGLIDAQGAGAVIISDGNLTAQNLTDELIVDQNNTANSMAISANITGNNSSFVKAGVGTLILAGTNTYGSTTWINQGTVVNNGTETGTTNVYVNPGATLAGTGQINASGNFYVAGTLAPGNATGLASTGTLTLSLTGNNKLVFESGASELAFDINGANSDTLAFSTPGDWLSGSGTATLALNATGVLAGTPYVVFHDVSTAGFTFADITGTPVGYAPTLTFTGANGGAYGESYADDYVLTFAETPEPSTWAMMGLGALGLVFLVRRKIPA